MATTGRQGPTLAVVLSRRRNGLTAFELRVQFHCDPSMAAQMAPLAITH